MEEVTDQLQSSSIWPAVMEEVVDHLQRKKYLTTCNERNTWQAAMEEAVDHLQGKKY